VLSLIVILLVVSEIPAQPVPSRPERASVK